MESSESSVKTSNATVQVESLNESSLNGTCGTCKQSNSTRTNPNHLQTTHIDEANALRLIEMVL